MKGEVDNTDDWMNPPKRDYTYTPPKYPRFLIQRKRSLDHFPFEEWDFWSVYPTREERDEKLADLRKSHPAWQLRKFDELSEPRAYL